MCDAYIIACALHDGPDMGIDKTMQQCKWPAPYINAIMNIRSLLQLISQRILEFVTHAQAIKMFVVTVHENIWYHHSVFAACCLFWHGVICLLGTLQQGDAAYLELLRPQRRAN